MMFRHPQVKNEKHLKYIRGLRCCLCGDNTQVEAAHIRMPAPHVGKRETGKGEKPDDRWTVPLCHNHHDQQHTMGEQRFWSRYHIDPISLALALWTASGDAEIGDMIISESICPSR